MDLVQATKIVSDCAILMDKLNDRMVEKLVAIMGEQHRKEIGGLERIDIAKDGSLTALISIGNTHDNDVEFLPIEEADLAGLDIS